MGMGCVGLWMRADDTMEIVFSFWFSFLVIVG